MDNQMHDRSLTC